MSGDLSDPLGRYIDETTKLLLTSGQLIGVLHSREIEIEMFLKRVSTLPLYPSGDELVSLTKQATALLLQFQRPLSEPKDEDADADESPKQPPA